MEVCGLLEVEPFTVRPRPVSEEFPDGVDVGARHCDVCGGSGPDDGRGTWRTFYYDPCEHLSICEHCVEAYLGSKP